MPSPVQEVTTKHNIFKVVLKDVVALIGLAILVASIHFGIRPFKRGIFCTDETIRYPHKESTVSSALLYSLGTLINIILILIFEYINLVKASRTNNETRDDKSIIATYEANVYCRLVVWLFGALTSELFTDIAKVSAGRLRPHFVDKCQPFVVGARQNLTDYCIQTSDPHRYITDYICNGSDSMDIRKSFMSGHSSYAAYSAIHAVLYLQSAMKKKDLDLLRSLMQVVLVSLAFYTGLSRISDYKHHWQDVTVGLAQGTLVALVVARYLWPTFHESFFRNTKLTEAREETYEINESLSRVRY